MAEQIPPTQAYSLGKHIQDVEEAFLNQGKKPEEPSLTPPADRPYINKGIQNAEEAFLNRQKKGEDSRAY
jgi:hypothetical protein